MFTKYVAAWLPDILVEISTGTRPSVNCQSDITRTSTVKLLTTIELPLGYIKATLYTTLSPMIRVRETIKVKFEMLICHWRHHWWLIFESEPCHCHFFNEEQLCCENSFYVICLKRNNCVVKNSFYVMCLKRNNCVVNFFMPFKKRETTMLWKLYLCHLF